MLTRAILIIAVCVFVIRGTRAAYRNAKERRRVAETWWPDP